MTIQALFLDLDDTLLVNDMETFAPHYFKALMAKVQGVCAPGPFVEALNLATRAMWRNDGRNGTNAEVFRRDFFPRLGRKPEDLMPLLEEFYARDFEALRPYTAVDPEARLLVTLARQRGYQLAITTQPIFPLTAIQARLRWAEVGDEEFHYEWITCYENMSACKPHPHYFSTVLNRLGRAAGECLMAGDSLEADMAAGKLGLKTFWVDRGREGAAPPKSGPPPYNACGGLRELRILIESGRIHEL